LEGNKPSSTSASGNSLGGCSFGVSWARAVPDQNRHATMAGHDQRTIQTKLHFGQERQFASIPLTFLVFPMMTIIYWYRLAGPANFAQIFS
jgi:hypothetical protein